MKIARTTLLSVLLVSFAGSRCRAQCEGRWLPGAPIPGADSAVSAIAELPSGTVILGGYFTAAGNTRAGSIVGFDPGAGRWFTLGAGVDQDVSALAVAPAGDLLVGGFFRHAGAIAADYMARWNPATGAWTPMPGLRGPVRAILALPSGDVLAAGLLDGSGYDLDTGDNVARWSAATSTWSLIGSAERGWVFALAALDNGDIIAGGQYFDAEYNGLHAVRRRDHATGEWSDLGSGLMGEANSLGVLSNGDVVVSGAYLAQGTVQRWSAAAGAWSPIGGPAGVGTIKVLPDGDLIAGGTFPAAHGLSANIARWHFADGVWSALASGITSPVSSLSVGPTENIIAGTSQYRGSPVRWTPSSQTWSPLDATIPPPPRITQVASLPDGSTLVAGDFHSASGDSLYGVARRISDAAPWQMLGGPMDGFVEALHLTSQGEIYAGGYFTAIDGAPIHGIAKWSPLASAWQPMGEGVNDVRAIASLPNGDIIVGTTYADFLHRWSAATQTWSSISGLDCGADALAVLPTGDVIVGGCFERAGDVVTRGIVRLAPDGEWHAMQDPAHPILPDSVYALAVLSGGDLVALGDFIEPGSDGEGFVGNITARWNPATEVWSILSSDSNASGYAVRPLPNGDIIVGGQFATMGGVPANNIARWSTASARWASLGAGVTDSVFSIAAAPRGDIVAAGDFAAAGNSVSASIARWTAGPICPADFNCSSGLSAQDIFDFLAAWFAADPRADFNGVNGISVQDIFDFLAAWFGGC